MCDTCDRTEDAETDGERPNPTGLQGVWVQPIFVALWRRDETQSLYRVLTRKQGRGAAIRRWCSILGASSGACPVFGADHRGTGEGTPIAPPVR
jgi:hypothetical protein